MPVSCRCAVPHPPAPPDSLPVELSPDRPPSSPLLSSASHQVKLDRLFDKGYLRKSEIDTVLLEDIESERGPLGWRAAAGAAQAVQPWLWGAGAASGPCAGLFRPPRGWSRLKLLPGWLPACPAELNDDEAGCVVDRLTEANLE